MPGAVTVKAEETARRRRSGPGLGTARLSHTTASVELAGLPGLSSTPARAARAAAALTTSILAEWGAASGRLIVLPALAHMAAAR